MRGGNVRRSVEEKGRILMTKMEKKEEEGNDENKKKREEGESLGKFMAIKAVTYPYKVWQT